jgi:hypothetical protein
MRHIKQYIFTILALSQVSFAAQIVPVQQKFDALSVEKSIKESAWKKVLKNEIYVSSKVDDFKKLSVSHQKLSFKIAGLHPKSCRYALRKLSHYESYQNHLGFIDKSEYDEKKERVNFHLSSTLLPYDMTLNFHIPRIKKPGVYPFVFDRGFLRGLNGQIIAIKHKKRCLFYTHASWQGPHSGIPNTIFAFFSKALAGLSMKNLFRISSTY